MLARSVRSSLPPRSIALKTIRSVLLLFRFPPDFAGGGLQAARLMEQLAAQDVDMRVLTMRSERGRGPSRERAYGGDVTRFRVFGGRGGRDIMLSFRAAWWLLVHRDWDVLHISGFSYFGVLPLLVAKLKGRPVLVKTTMLGKSGAFNRGGSWPARLALGCHARADVIVALSQALEDALRRQEKLPARVLQIPNGVDTDLFRPARGAEREEAREAFDLPQESLVVVTCSMLYPRKNLVALVRAAGAMKARPVCLGIAGPPGPDVAYLRELDEAIEELPEGVEVRLLGSLDPDRLAELHRAADIYALVSRAEGMPNALLEGMATGLACVASDIPGPADVLAPGGGLLVPLDDDLLLARELDRLAADPVERRRMGQEARKLIEDRYSFTHIAERYRAVYAELLAETREEEAVATSSS
jgi:glycosyltransferase involved in cell wall biosynthesis